MLISWVETGHIVAVTIIKLSTLVTDAEVNGEL